MENKRRSSLRSSMLLLLTAFIWGVAFVAQSEGMNYVGGFTFIGARYLIGGVVLLPYLIFMRKRNPEWKQLKTEEQKKQNRIGIIGGICCGIALCVASSLQQFGIFYTTVGKAGFITALYIVIVPLLGLFLKKKAGLHIWLSVIIAAIGMYLLCITEGFSIGKGDFLVLLCAVVFSFHILIIDYVSPKADGVLISCVQFFTAGLLGTILTVCYERATISSLLAAWAPILYAGVCSSGIGYTLQIVAQKDVEPTVASLLMSMESVFSMLAGWVLLGETLSGRELAGCLLVFAAIILAQLPMSELAVKDKL